MPAGRPSTRTPEVTTAICAMLAEGMSLREICRRDEMPGLRTVCTWLAEDENFQQQYARAREVQADIIFDEITEIVDDGRNDWMARQDDGGGVEYRLNGEHVQRSKLRMEARKWMAGKMRPKRYGDRILAEHSGPDGGPIKTETESASTSQLAQALLSVLEGKGSK